MTVLLKCVFALVFVAPLARGDLLVSWEPEGLSAELGGWPNPWKPAGVAKNVDARDGMRLGPGLRIGGLNNAWGSAANFTSRTRAAAEQSGQYFVFEVAPKPGHVLALSALEMNVRLTDATLNHGVWYVWEYRIGNHPFVTIGKPVFLSTATGARDEIPGRGMRLPPLDLSSVDALRRVEGVAEFRLVSWSDKLPRYHFNIGRLDGADLVLRGEVKPRR